MIYIFSGPIRSGKTTALQHWSARCDNVDGILSPDNENGDRFFYEIKSAKSFRFEASQNSQEPTVSIGRFRFLKSAFNRANNYLIDTINDSGNKYLIIDEVGKLELKSQGLHNALQHSIPNFESSADQHLVLVVRASLLDIVVSFYKIKRFQLLTKDTLNTIG